MKIYALLDKHSGTIWDGNNKPLMTTNDEREILAAYETMVNDEKYQGDIRVHYIEDFAIVCLGTIEQDHIEPTRNEKGEPIKYYLVKELRDLKHYA